MWEGIVAKLLGRWSLPYKPGLCLPWLGASSSARAPLIPEPNFRP